MTTENNNSANALIAEFMGLGKTIMFFNFKTGNYVKNENDDCNINAVEVYLKNRKPIINFHYHSDWNWLMEVVNKITTLNEFQEYEFNSLFWDIFCQLNIKEVYTQVVLFIEWYNQNK